MIGRAGLRFAYRLALALGRVDVNAMLAEMTSAELAGWHAYFTLEPWGCEVEDHRAAKVCATVANFAGKKLSDGQTAKPSDYFPSRIPEPEPDVDAQIRGIFGPMVKESDDGDE